MHQATGITLFEDKGMIGTHQDSNSFDFHGNTSWQDSDWEEIAKFEGIPGILD
jgi:hypothetical protein